MKLKYLCILLAGCILITTMPRITLASEENTIWIEAESYDTAGTKSISRRASEFSGSKIFRVYEAYDAAYSYLIAYTFYAPKKGYYNLSGVASLRGQSYTTDYTIYVNDKANAVSEYTALADFDSTEYPKVFKNYNMGNVKVNKGENTLYVQLNTADKASNNIVSMFDYFKLEPAKDLAFALESIGFSGSEVGTFQEGEDVALIFHFTKEAPKGVRYKFKITDLWSRQVKADTVTVQPGVSDYTLSFGAFDVGWYRVTLYEQNSETAMDQYLAFSVTQPLNKRAHFEETTLAADLAAEYDEGSRKRIDAIAKASQLAGFSWVRERRASGNPDSETLSVKKAIDQTGIKSLSVDGSSAAVVNSEQDKYWITDLQEVAYSKWKEIPGKFKNYTDMFEVFNELDLKAGVGPGDGYGSYFKAAAIGMSDSPEDPYVSMTGLAGFGSKFSDLIMQNDILNYSAVLNYHAHAEVDTRTMTARALANAYTDGDPVQLLLGEAGIHQIVNDTGALTEEQMRVATRYVVTSFMMSLSNGNDKHFWFLLRPYLENNGNYSAFHTSYLPYPMYSALSNLTYQLGEGKFKGELANLPEEAQGYLFDDGLGNDVAVLWSKSPNYMTIHADRATYADLMGYEEEKEGENGEIRVPISQDPVFIKFHGRSDLDNYYPMSFTQAPLKKGDFKPNERIVIQQIWDNQDYLDAHDNGYTVQLNEPVPIKVNVYNLNDKPMSGKIIATNDKFMESDVAEQPFELEPWGKTQLSFTMKTTDQAYGAAEGNIKFSGVTTEGEPISNSVSRYKISMVSRVIEPKDYVVFDDFYKKEKWDIKNISSGGKNIMTEDDENKQFSMKLNFTGQVWSFPYFPIEDSSIFDGTAGLVFDRLCDENSTSEKTSVFVYLKDGRNYYSGANSAVPYTNEWQQLVFPWTMFSLYYSPLGAVDIREFETKDIVKISVGISGGRKDHPKYTIKNLAYFYSDLPSDQLKAGSLIKTSGIVQDEIYPEGTPLTLTAQLPDDEIESVKIMMENDVYDRWTWDGKQVTINCDGLKRGKYRLYLFAKNKVNKVHIASVTFYIS